MYLLSQIYLLSFNFNYFHLHVYWQICQAVAHGPVARIFYGELLCAWVLIKVLKSRLNSGYRNPPIPPDTPNWMQVAGYYILTNDPHTQGFQLSRIIWETPDFEPFLPVSRLESEISHIIAKVCHFLYIRLSDNEISNILRCFSCLTVNMEGFLTNSGMPL